MNHILAVVLALAAAVHVGLPGLPAPAPVLMTFALVIGALVFAIWGAAIRSQPHWRAGT